MSLVSVIIPAYNCERFLAEAVESVLAQTHGDVEAIVVEDGSQDGTLEVARRFEADARCRVFTHEGGVNRGVSLTRKLGIRRSKGEYIAFLDADDVFEPERIALQLEAMARHPKAVLCHSAASVLYEDEKDAETFSHTFEIAPEEFEYRMETLDNFLIENPVCNSSVLAKAEAVRAGFVASRQLFQYEDWLNWIMLSGRGSFVFLPDRLVRYRYHGASATARLLGNDLRHYYSYLEMLFTLSAHLGGFRGHSKIAPLVSARIEETVARLVEVYSPEARRPRPPWPPG